MSTSITVSEGLESSPNYFKPNSSFELITEGNDSGRKKEPVYKDDENQ
ncbi:MAG: hypothetical protein ACR2IS_11915 [Nitrososphaeraceae archaeon]